MLKKKWLHNINLINTLKVILLFYSRNYFEIITSEIPGIVY